MLIYDCVTFLNKKEKKTLHRLKVSLNQLTVLRSHVLQKSKALFT